MKFQNLNLSVIVPVYNEEKRLEAPISHVFEYLSKNLGDWEAIYVDDGSSDSTYNKLLELRAAHRTLRVLHYEKNRGKGFAIRRGFESARGNPILFSDADLSTPIEELDKFMGFLDIHDIIIGSRRLLNSTTVALCPRFKVGRLTLSPRSPT